VALLAQAWRGDACIPFDLRPILNDGPRGLELVTAAPCSYELQSRPSALTKLRHKYHSANDWFGVGGVHTGMIRCRHHGNPVEAEVPLVGSAVAVQAMLFARACRPTATLAPDPAARITIGRGCKIMRGIKPTPNASQMKCSSRVDFLNFPGELQAFISGCCCPADGQCGAFWGVLWLKIR
jgi:hypothetical protein